jgi:hypothetical protein
MTGRDLILYILKNKLEDEPVFKDGKFIGFASDLETAAEMHVGVETVRVLFDHGSLDGIRIGDTIYISRF